MAGSDKRALEPTALFWAAMYAASALGTNIGDFWSDGVGLGLASSFATLALLSLALIAADRALWRSTEAFYWLAIVVLRAAATNVGDYLTDDLSLSRLVTTPALAAATLAAGWFTLGRRTPLIEARYWLAMVCGGAFGTVGGDLASHALGLPLATAALGVVLIGAVAAFSRAASAPLLAYWLVVLAERAAGTPAGDLFAEERGLGLGLPIAMAITGAAFAATLILRSRRAPGVAVSSAQAR